MKTVLLNIKQLVIIKLESRQFHLEGEGKVRLRDKVCIVTGAARGIGRQIALNIAKHGGIPVLVDLDEKGIKEAVGEIQSGQADTFGYVLDVTNISEVKDMVASAFAKYGRIDVLVNCAGILSTTPVEDVTEKEWDNVLSVNLKAPFFLSQQVFLRMKQQNSGRIINIASLAGRMGGYGTGCAYSSSKAGIIGMTMCLARKMAPHNITVNAVAPGTTEGELVKGFTPEVLISLKEKIPLGRLARLDDVASAVIFLASDEAAFITGAVLDVNGGMFMG